MVSERRNKNKRVSRNVFLQSALAEARSRLVVFRVLSTSVKRLRVATNSTSCSVRLC